MQIASSEFDAKNDLLPSISSQLQQGRAFLTFLPVLPHCIKKLRRELPLLEEKLPKERHGNHHVFSYLWRFEGPFHFVSIRFHACYLVPRKMRALMPLASAFQPAPAKLMIPKAPVGTPT